MTRLANCRDLHVRNYYNFYDCGRLIVGITTTTTTKSFSQVFGVGYMNQKRITPDRVHGLTFSTHSYQVVCLY